MNGIALMLQGRAIPDPARAHGAWVYLGLSILAGLLSSIGEGPTAALGAGLGFAGAFIAASSLAPRATPERRRRLVLGIGLGISGPMISLALGAHFFFLLLGLAALPPVVLSGYFGARRGFQSAPALGFAIAALAVAAPSSACAGGASLGEGALLLALLAGFFTYRGLKLRTRLAAHQVRGRSAIRREGLREALLGTIWTLTIVGLMHLLVF